MVLEILDANLGLLRKCGDNKLEKLPEAKNLHLLKSMIDSPNDGCHLSIFDVKKHIWISKLCSI